MGSDPADVAPAVMGTQDVQRTTGRSKLYGLVHKLPAHTGWVRNPIQCSQYRSTRSREAGNIARETAYQHVSGLVWQAIKAKKGAPDSFVRVHESTKLGNGSEQTQGKDGEAESPGKRGLSQKMIGNMSGVMAVAPRVYSLSLC
ncbi:hypothetical protein M431DRAFT_416560 [Trichoderma harzianum CBS 226.95]|jgi:hypothetical protein|uniref:Uncharacterized protein n=1 Tax=Trichoderma harzianum CBS 226.95 TaxID=983964 RepID=A0A2T4AG42_TRIHA|nr:hypothetical protein M431DRAFT_416560 [Trichoderma harzianum CBS 226.95]PTB56060.1 hypothetical protein M431DRAFT_416560 [Trichoderma harzianum CBS 226.95]